MKLVIVIVIFFIMAGFLRDNRDTGKHTPADDPGSAGSFNSYPHWSPDGASIVFASDRHGNHEIYRIGANGQRLVRLTEHDSTDSHPAWSPDGSMIAFESQRDGNREIYVMQADGSELRRMTTHPAWDGAPSWHPNGGNLRNISNHEAADIMAQWSPDGERLIFVSNRAGSFDLYTITLHSGQVELLEKANP